jgi:hypothetical protein
LESSRLIWRTTRAKAVENLSQRDHAHFEDTVLHFAEAAVEAAMQPLQFGA